jgi:thymidylate synthase
MNILDIVYQDLLQAIIDSGVKKQTRNGETLSLFGYQIRHDISVGFPLLTTKKMAWKSIVTELLWFLRGSTNIKYLVDNGCHIWDGDAYKAYLNRIEGSREDMIFDKETFINEIKNNDSDHFWVKQFGELGPIYGKQWRDWIRYEEEPYQRHNEIPIDQIANLISELKTNPDSRRLMVNAWNVGELSEMVLPPCHYGFQVYTRELSLEERLKLCNVDIDMDIDEAIKRDDRDIIKKYLDYTNTPTRAISLMWNQRSVDTFLGLPFNIASYGLLLEIIAKEVNMIPDELIGNLGDVHLYSNHIEQAKEQIGREPFELPKLGMDYREGEYNKNLKDFTPDDFYLINYQSHPAIKAPLSN